MERISVIAIGAHPDDVEILCAGTLAKYARLGHKVAICYATDGQFGHVIIKPDELREMRRREAERSCSVIGAEMIWLGYQDEFIFDDKETRLRFIEAIRKVRASLIITHDPNDYHEDHRIVSRLATTAGFLASVPNIKTESEALDWIPPVYYMDTLAGIGFLPTDYVDITEDIETKLKMLSCHESQVKWLMEHDGVDILDLVRTVNKFRGLQVGVAYAEGFRRHEAWGRMAISTERLLP